MGFVYYEVMLLCLFGRTVEEVDGEDPREGDAEGDARVDERVDYTCSPINDIHFHHRTHHRVPKSHEKWSI